MKAVGIRPSPEGITIFVAEDAGSGPTIVFRDHWPVPSEDRLGGYVQIRARLIERLTQWAPDGVAVSPFEPFALVKAKPQISSFLTAELRGIALEASRSVCENTATWLKSDVGSALGARSAAQYHDDEAFWSGVFPETFPKKYRDAALLALAILRDPDKAASGGQLKNKAKKKKKKKKKEPEPQ